MTTRNTQLIQFFKAQNKSIIKTKKMSNYLPQNSFGVTSREIVLKLIGPNCLMETLDLIIKKKGSTNFNVKEEQTETRVEKTGNLLKKSVY